MDVLASINNDVVGVAALKIIRKLIKKIIKR